MKRLFSSALLCLASITAFADTNTLVKGFVVTTGAPSLYAGAGTGKALAVGCADTQAQAAKAVVDKTPYTCKTPMSVTPQAKQPADKQQLAQCAAGFTGQYLQLQTSTFDLSTNTWPFTGKWLPAQPPAGVCTIIKPPQPANVLVTNQCVAPQVGTWISTITTIYNPATNSYDAQPATPSVAPTGACTTPVVTPPASFLPVIDMNKLPAAAPGWSVPRLQATSQTINPADVGAFRLGCFFSHMSFNDPLVYPGQKGKSHGHFFFGNTGTDENSTAESVASTGNSTCSGGTLNRTSYWAPAMIDTTDGSPVVPSALLVYYKTGYGGVKPADVKAVPTGLRMISGLASGTPANPSTAGRFACVGGPDGTPGVGWQATIPAVGCSPGQSLIMEVSFPQCWDGVNLSSPDNKSHMAETTGSGCPKTHPVALPAIAYEIYISITAANASHMAKWRLTSDNYAATSPGGYSSHGDYLMGWDPATMAKIIKNCDNPSMDCHANLLGDGTWLY